MSVDIYIYSVFMYLFIQWLPPLPPTPKRNNTKPTSSQNQPKVCRGEFENVKWDWGWGWACIGSQLNDSKKKLKPAQSAPKVCRGEFESLKWDWGRVGHAFIRVTLRLLNSS